MRYRFAALPILLALNACDTTHSSNQSQPSPSSITPRASANPPIIVTSLPKPYLPSPLPQDCPRPAVNLLTTHASANQPAPTPLIEAAFQAHPEFHLTSHKPTKPMQVALETYPHRQKDDSDHCRSFVIVARCADADTCNKAANMVAAVVPESTPETFCGATAPGTYGSGAPYGLSAHSPDDSAYQCARWTVCKRNVDAAYDPGPSCESIQQQVLACSKQKTCEKVVACGNSITP